MNEKTESIIGCILGTAVGDALGLPGEGLSKRRLQRIYPHVNQYDFFFGKGMVSDDTEHTCMVAQSLLVAGGNVRRFTRALAWRLRWWLLPLPAGVGLGTLRAIVKLWLGFPKPGVFSAGNGPAMRSAIIGVCYGEDLPKLREFVRASTRVTHTDPKAEYGAMAVAIAAHLATHPSPISAADYYHTLERILPPEAREFLQLIREACHSVTQGGDTESFASQLGLSRGVSGYVYHTVPVAIHAWLTHQQDYRSAAIASVRCGGDTDTTGAIVGGIIGAGTGMRGIPPEWLDNLWEWPRSVSWMKALGAKLAIACDRGVPESAHPLAWYGIILRNLFFLVVVLLHGLRRLLPPY